jgi:hypothetical protein
MLAPTETIREVLLTTEAIVAAALKALATLAAPGAQALSRERATKRAKKSPSWQALVLQGAAASGIQRTLLSSEISTGDQEVISDFLRAPEGRLLARYIAIDEVTERRSKAGDSINRQAHALLHLFAPEHNFDTQAATSLSAILRSASARIYEEMQRFAPEEASRVRDIAMSERNSRLFSSLDEVSRELWDLDDYSAVELRTAIADYCARLAERNSTISLPSLTESRRIPIDQIFVEPKLRAREWSESPSHDLESALRRHPRVVILGDPGGGKSTLIRAAARHFANENYGSTARVPIVISLAKYSNKRADSASPFGLVEYIAGHLLEENLASFNSKSLRYLLATGQCLLLFDGLDEIVRVDLRAEVRDQIETLALRYRSNQFVVTSRVSGYMEASLESGFRSFELQQLDEKQVVRFVRKFFVAVTPVDQSGLDNPVVEEFLSDSETIPDLRSNPLLLGLLCLLYNSDRTLPKNLADLYRDCATMLFSKWDGRRGIEQEYVAEPETAEDAVSAIALKVFESGEEDFSHDWLEQELKEFYRTFHDDSRSRSERFASQVLSLWRGRRWLLVRSGERDGVDYFRFSHRTFLEYFAAQQVGADCRTASELCQRISHYIASRSATVFCLLAVQLYARPGRGAGDEILEFLTNETMQGDLRKRWNFGAFSAECLPLVRAATSSKERACFQLTHLLVELVPLSQRSPIQQQLFEDVLDEVDVLDEENPNSTGHQSPADDVDVDDLASRRALTFSSAMLPLSSIGRCSGESWESLSKFIASSLRQLVSEGGSDSWRAKCVKFCAELRAFPYIEEWSALSSRQVSQFSQWAADLWEDSSIAAASLNCDGFDFWLDVYLARAGRARIDDLVRRRGLEGTLTGGWNLAVVQAPAAGTPMHHMYRHIARSKGLSDYSQSFLRILFITVSAKESNWDLDYFESKPGWLPPELGYEIVASEFSNEERAGLVFAASILAYGGACEAVDSLIRSTDNIAAILGRLASVVLYEDVADPDELADTAIPDYKTQSSVLRFLDA